MVLSFLQLNINADNFWDNLIPFLTKNNFDILQLQEIAGKESISGNIATKRDVFAELNKIFGERYDSELAISQRYTSSPSSYFGVATFYRKKFQLVEKNIITLYERTTPFPSDAQSYEKVGRNLLHLTLSIDGKTISFLNTHLAWAKTTKEQPHQTQQGEILFNYLQTVPSPFIFSGDFNIDPEQPLIKKFNSLAKNLIDEYHIVNTLNPRKHRAQVLFPPGAAVDYIFVTEDLAVKNFAVLENEDISDHLGLTAEIEI